MARLSRIQIYPVKSFDAHCVDQALMLASGALEYDRRYALRDRQGDFMNAKRTPAVHRLRTSFDPLHKLLTLRIEGTTTAHGFNVDTERTQLSAWLSDYFSTSLEFVEDDSAGFPDDTESPGPTVISTATLVEVASWFPGVSVDEVRTRFRANLEIDGVEPFWEDRLVDAGSRAVRFRLGEIQLAGSNPCQRCVVPTRDPTTGEVLREFAKRFGQRRQETLPPWAPRSRFDHFYRLSTNTRPVDGQQGMIRVGDDLRILG